MFVLFMVTMSETLRSGNAAGAPRASPAYYFHLAPTSFWIWKTCIAWTITHIIYQNIDGANLFRRLIDGILNSFIALQIDGLEYCLRAWMLLLEIRCDSLQFILADN